MLSTRVLLLAGAVLLAPDAHSQTAPGAPAGASGAPSAQEILDAAKAASGGAAWDRLTTTHDQGKVSVGGLSGSFDDWLDWVHVKAGRARRCVGPATGAQGWDGQDLVERGCVRPGADGKQRGSSGGGGWRRLISRPRRRFSRSATGAQIAYAGTRGAGGVAYQVLRITPKLSDPVELWFDPGTHLPVRSVELTGAQPRTTVFSDFRGRKRREAAVPCGQPGSATIRIMIRWSTLPRSKRKRCPTANSRRPRRRPTMHSSRLVRHR